MTAHDVSKLVFWAALALALYTYFGYPFLLYVMAKLHKLPVKRYRVTPSVSLIVPYYNEETRIEQKIDNCLELLYPRSSLEIIFASDCSTDRSDEIVRSYADRGIRHVRLEERKGKHYAQGAALEIASGEIIVFTDARIHLPPDAIEKIVCNFADPAVGCVSSVDKVQNEVGKPNSEGVYIRYDMLLRRLESQTGSTTGMSGAFYAARRSLCGDWIPYLSNDFYIPLRAVMARMRAIVDPEAVGYYNILASPRSEFSRKVRTIVHGIDVLFHFPRILNPFRYPCYSLKVISHKLLRWLIPFLAVATLVSSYLPAETETFYLVAFLAQAGVLFIAGAVHLVPPLQKLGILRSLYFLVIANLAIVVAWFQWIRGKSYSYWEPTRR